MKQKREFTTGIEYAVIIVLMIIFIFVPSVSGQEKEGQKLSTFLSTAPWALFFYQTAGFGFPGFCCTAAQRLIGSPRSGVF
ncbi:MAG: hypothetical protein KAW12_16710 [Candidatus Aminicenantes bacterium]|nr:hypothetical protein [Candidatus Aminicenantes bacterium]